MSVLRVIWKIIVGGGCVAGGWHLVMPELAATLLTVATIIGIALIAVGASILAGVFE